MTGLRLERIRTGYEAGNRSALWLLLALSVLVLFARHVTPLLLVGRLDEQLLTAGDVLSALPVLFAAAAVLVAPGRRLVVAGALVLAGAAVLETSERLAPVLPSEIAIVAGLLAAPLAVAGPLLFGHGLGGVRTRLGLAIVAAGLVLALVNMTVAFGSGRSLLEVGAPLGPALLAGSLIAQFALLGWAYVLAAAVERRSVLISSGAALLLLDNVLFLLVDIFVRPGPTGVWAGGYAVYVTLNLAAWAALIAGVIREVDGAGEASGEMPRSTGTNLESPC